MGQALFKSLTPFRSDEMAVVLESGEGAEVKASMAAGQRLVSIGPPMAPSTSHAWRGGRGRGGAHSYWKEDGQSSGHGALEAPFAGNHGWFWQNLGPAPVKVTVETSGFYEKLYLP